jgi:hypothetical protein
MSLPISRALAGSVFLWVSLAAAKDLPLRYIEPTLGFRAEGLAFDGDGLLWIGGEQRLVQYDGVRFRDLPITGTVYDVAHSPDGWIYVATSTGLWRGRGREIALVYRELASAVVGVSGGAILSMESGNIALWRPGGVFKALPPGPGHLGRPTRDPAGDVFLAVGPLVFRLAASDIQANRLNFSEFPASRDPQVGEWIWAGRDTAGVLWLCAFDSLARLAPGNSQPEVVAKRQSPLWRSFQDPDG